MPTKRSYSNGSVVYYFRRTLGGIGRVYQSLGTDRKGLARRREEALVAAHRQGHHDLVRAWMEGEVSIEEVQAAYERDATAELARALSREDPPLEAACKRALRDKSPDVSATTLSGYRSALARFRTYCTAQGKEGTRAALTTGVLQGFKSWCLEEVQVAKQTVNNYLTAVSVLATYAMRQGWIDTRPEFRTYETRVRVTYLEADTLAAYFAELRPRFRPLMRLLIGTGMRLGEAEALTPADLKLGNGEARAAIEDSKTPTGVRTVFVPPSAAEVVRAHIDRYDRSDDEPIFQVPRRTVQKEHNRARERIGRPGYTIHDHRHTAAVHLARAGMPLHLLQQQLGHANIDMTMRYARFHPDYGDVAEYFDRVDEGLGLSPAPAPEATEVKA